MRKKLTIDFPIKAQCIIGLLFIFAVPALSTPVVSLSDPSGSYRLSKEISCLWDYQNRLTFQEVLTDSINNAFKDLGGESTNFGIVKTNVWCRIHVKNLNPEIKNWYIEVGYPHIDSLNFYYQDENNQWMSWLVGDRLKFMERPVDHKNFILPVELPDTITRTFYFHLTGEGSKQLPLTIQTEKQFYSSQAGINMIYGVFFGIMSIMIIYNFFIFISLRDLSYLFYVITNMAVMLFYLSYTGYGYQYLWKAYPGLNSFITLFAGLLSAFTFIFFSMNFLDVKRYIPWLNKILWLFIVAYMVVFLIMPIADYVVIMKIGASLAFLSAVFCFLASYIAWFKGNTFAKYMAIAFSFYLFGAMLLIANIGGFFPKNFLIIHSMELGTLIELTLLSFALSDKYSSLRKEKEKAQAEVIRLQKEANVELEKMVRERTTEVNLQKVKLQESNRMKDKLLSILTHDLRGPLFTFQKILSVMVGDQLTEKNVKMYTKHLNDKLSVMLGLIENILHWIKSQMHGFKLDMQKVNIKDLIVEHIELFRSQAEFKNIEIVNEVNDAVFAFTDKNVVRLVIRNLLSNALKFTESGGTVRISASHDANRVLVKIKDTGVGMTDEMIIKLFNPDTHFSTEDTTNTGGTGLGLLLCKEFLQKASGSIYAESEAGKGSTFYFTLPVTKKSLIAQTEKVL